MNWYWLESLRDFHEEKWDFDLERVKAFWFKHDFPKDLSQIEAESKPMF